MISDKHPSFYLGYSCSQVVYFSCVFTGGVKSLILFTVGGGKGKETSGLTLPLQYVPYFAESRLMEQAEIHA